MTRIKCIGIIAEDNSDFESIRILIRRILNRENLGFKKAIGNGCGKLRRKADDYAVDLSRKKCDMLILVHDLDRCQYDALFLDLTRRLANSPIEKKLICIPIEELEAWFLSDPTSLKDIFGLKRQPKFKGVPEAILSPKETLGNEIYLCSGRSVIYINTKHNAKIAQNISIELVRKKCSSFNNLSEFLLQYEYS